MQRVGKTGRVKYDVLLFTDEMEGFLQRVRAIDLQGLGKTDRVNYDILLFTDGNERVSPARTNY